MTPSSFPSDLVAALALPLDFDTTDVSEDCSWFKVTPSIPLSPIASDGSGGMYCVLNESKEILFVDSEGAAGIIAPSFMHLMALFITYPFWRDLLKFSGKGSLEQMTRAIPFARDDWFESYPETPDAIALVKNYFGIATSENSLRVLHSCVSSSHLRITLSAPDGHPFHSLFNHFTVESNPVWKRKLE